MVKSMLDVPDDKLDPWYDIIAHITKERDIKKTTTAEIASLMDIPEPSRAEQIRIGTELQRLGFRRIRVRHGKRLVNEYHDTGRPPPSVNPIEPEEPVHTRRSYSLTRREALKLLRNKSKSPHKRRVHID